MSPELRFSTITVTGPSLNSEFDVVRKPHSGGPLSLESPTSYIDNGSSTHGSLVLVYCRVSLRASVIGLEEGDITRTPIAQYDESK